MTKLTPARAEQFILENTALIAPPHVPEIQLHLADESHALWLKTEEELAEIGLPPPFWAFAWAGGQGLARYVFDYPEFRCGQIGGRYRYWLRTCRDCCREGGRLVCHRQ